MYFYLNDCLLLVFCKGCIVNCCFFLGFYFFIICDYYKEWVVIFEVFYVVMWKGEWILLVFCRLGFMGFMVDFVYMWLVCFDIIFFYVKDCVVWLEFFEELGIKVMVCIYFVIMVIRWFYIKMVFYILIFFWFYFYL